MVRLVVQEHQVHQAAVVHQALADHQVLQAVAVHQVLQAGAVRGPRHRGQRAGGPAGVPGAGPGAQGRVPRGQVREARRGADPGDEGAAGADRRPQIEAQIVTVSYL